MGRCDECIYWKKKPDKDQALSSNPNHAVGWCHFFPPVTVAQGQSGRLVSRFPVTWEYNWCGQFRSIDDEVEEIKHRYQTKGVNRDNG